MALDLNDKTSNNNTLTNVNGVTEVTTSLPFSASTSAAGFASASNQYLTAADSASLSQTGTMTIEFWIKYTTLPTAGNAIQIVAKDNGSTQRSYGVYDQNVAGTHQLHIYISDNAGNFDDYYITHGPATGTWYHYAFTITPANASATTFEFFLNGVSQGNGTANLSNNISAIADTNVVFSLGARSDGLSPINAQMDDVRVWSTVRTSTQISTNYQNELSGGESGLVAYYPFEATIPAKSGGSFLLNFL